MAIEIVYHGHKGQHREYYICLCCGTAFYDDTFTPLNKTGIYPSPLCPVCGVLPMHVDEEKFETYIKAHNYLAEHISTEGCADRAPNGTGK